VHVLDASRVIDVVSSLAGERRAAFDAANRAEQESIREKYQARREKPLLPYERAVANRLRVDFAGAEPPAPAPRFIGRTFLDVPLGEVARFIDWTFFFSAWELKGRFPGILDHPQYGPAARDLYAHARALLERILSEGLLAGKAAYAFFPAAAEGDDILLFADGGAHREVLARLPMLRQQEAQPDGRPNLCLADFVAPRETGVPDHLGLFAVTAGLGTDDLVRRFEADQDDYRAIMVKALADRLAEASAAWLHARVRAEWGGVDDPAASLDDILAEKHRGIRPAYGYPACPDHSGKAPLFAILEAAKQGLSLTEHGAMLPAASVSGLYFAHPRARYFNVGRIGRDQVESYARRKGMTLAEVERWLAPNLAYDP
jgi:5-methyltetrahydrofolate--homocysteine methyltransferase